MGWPLEHLLVLRHRRVAGVNQYTEFRHQQPDGQRGLTDFSQWLLQAFCRSLLSAFSGEA